jgi:two-component sensor histidine kinase
LYLLDANTDSIVDYFGKASRDISHRFPFEILHDAYVDDAGIFWFATNGEGLFRWDRNKNAPEFKQFGTTDGLPSDILYRIESDDHDNLWISTDNGLVRFNTKIFKTSTYTTVDGISHNEFNRTSSFKAADGRIFFGGLDGVNAFYPTDFLSDSVASEIPVRLISFNKFSAEENKLVDETNNLISQNKIVLQPGDRFFNLEFQLLDFDEGKPNYAYMIEGIDKDWNYISENSIRISGLPYGNFTLRVKGQNVDGAWSKNELTIPVEVIAPFYKSAWFVVALFLGLAVIIVLFTRFRTQQLEKTNAMLESKVGERTIQLQQTLAEKDVLIKEIHHRVKNNRQVISTLLELQTHGLMDEKSKAALQESQNRVQAIALIHQRLYEHESFGAINMDEFMRDLYNQIANVFKKGDQDVNASFDLHNISFDIDTAVPIGLMLNELLTNSFKYAFSGRGKNEIYIGMRKENGTYELSFRDSGRGLPPDFNFATARSLGIRLVNLLAKQLNGTAKYVYREGAQFDITFKGKK